jgi:hypothetical protein
MNQTAKETENRMLWFWLATGLGIVIAVINLVRQKYTIATFIIFSLTIAGLVVQGIKYYDDNVGKSVFLGEPKVSTLGLIWSGFAGAYDILELHCDNLEPSTTNNAYFDLLYGEGSGPTFASSGYSSETSDSRFERVASQMPTVGILITPTLNERTSFTAHIGSVSSSSAYKTASGTGTTYSPLSYSTLSFTFAGYYVLDTKPITGLLLRAYFFTPPENGKPGEWHTVPFTGTCSLYGRSSG